MKVKHLPYNQKLEEKLRSKLYQRSQFTGLYKSQGIQSAPISDYCKAMIVSLDTIKKLIIANNGCTFSVRTINNGTKEYHFTSLKKLDKWVKKNNISKFSIDPFYARQVQKNNRRN